MNRDEVWQAVDHQRRDLAVLFDGLTAEEWETPSLCAGWRVREVAAHLTLAHTGVLAGAVGLVRARGNLHRMIYDTAVRRAALPDDAYGRLLRGMVGSRRTAPGVSYLEPLLDVLVHAQDVAVPLGRARPMPPVAAATAATRAWTRWRRMFGTARALDGMRLVATDVDWSAGQGAVVEGPIAALLLLVTGRPAALRQLTGAGTVELAARMTPARTGGS